MKYNIISIAIPVISVIIFVLAVMFLEPTTTGLAIYDLKGANDKVNADVTLSTKAGEVIPNTAIVQVWIDDKMASMTVQEFIIKTGEEYEISNGEIPEFRFYGQGFTGEHTYKLTLADFPLNRKIGKGQHTFRTRIVYRERVLYEKENNIMIS